MRATIADSGLVEILKQQLAAGDTTYLEITPFCDRVVAGYSFACYRADLCSPEGVVYDAWLISGGPGANGIPCGGIYNLDNHIDINAALAQHVGALVLTGSIKLVPNAPE